MGEGSPIRIRHSIVRRTAPVPAPRPPRLRVKHGVLAMLVVLVMMGCVIPSLRSAFAGSLMLPLWPALELRPLHLPVLAHGADCPLTPSKYVHDGRPTDEMTGDGPVYVDGYSLVPYDFNPTTFGEQIWLIDPGYVGPVLVRARRLDASGVVLFSDQQGIRPWMADLHFAQNQLFDSAWTERTTYFPADFGCYGFQVDGTTFSYVIVIGYYNPGLL